MPWSSSGSFRAVCGTFQATLIHILTLKADTKAAARHKTVTLKSRKQSVFIGCALVQLFWAILLLQCGDVEINPGPIMDGSSPENFVYEKVNLRSIQQCVFVFFTRLKNGY